jgi:hypothetical protein
MFIFSQYFYFYNHFTRLEVERKRAYSKNNNQKPLVPSLDNQQRRADAR